MESTKSRGGRPAGRKKTAKIEIVLEPNIKAEFMELIASEGKTVKKVKFFRKKWLTSDRFGGTISITCEKGFLFKFSCKFNFFYNCLWLNNITDKYTCEECGNWH